MAMSAGDLQGQQGGAGTEGQQFGGQDSGQQQVQPQQQQQFGGGQGQQQAQGNSLGNDFLQRVALQDRPIVEKYIRDWDAGVTQRFQQIQNEARQYQQLGDYETLQTAVELLEMFNESPEAIYQFLQQQLQFGGQQQMQQGFQQAPQGFQQQFQQQPPQWNQQGYQQPPFQGQGMPLDPSQQSQVQGLPPEFQQKFSQMEQLVQTLGQGFLAQQQAAQEAAEDQALDQYLTGLRQRYGDFDEDFVLAKMQVGMDGEQAVQAFQAAYQQKVNGALQNQQSAPVVLSGGGTAPTEQQTIKDLPSKDVRSLVANLVANANQQGS